MHSQGLPCIRFLPHSHLVATMTGVSPAEFVVSLMEEAGVVMRNSRIFSCEPVVSFIQARWSTVSPSLSVSFQSAPWCISRLTTLSCKNAGWKIKHTNTLCRTKKRSLPAHDRLLCAAKLSCVYHWHGQLEIQLWEASQAPQHSHYSMHLLLS